MTSTCQELAFIWSSYVVPGASTGPIAVSLQTAVNLDSDEVSGPMVFIDLAPGHDEITDRDQLDALVEALQAIGDAWDRLTDDDQHP